MQNERLFRDSADRDLFQTELEEVLTELYPLIWLGLGQAPRDHLLKPVERYGRYSPLMNRTLRLHVYTGCYQVLIELVSHSVARSIT